MRSRATSGTAEPAASEPPTVQDGAEHGQLLGIGAAAAQAGVSERALRYYQQLGLITPCACTPGGMRRYSEDDLARVARIRQLQALLIVADNKQMFLLSGDGDVIEPDAVGDGLIATIGSGGSFALAAATALMENTNFTAREIVERSMKIAAEICIYSNQSITIEELKAGE